MTSLSTIAPPRVPAAPATQRAPLPPRRPPPRRRLDGALRLFGSYLTAATLLLVLMVLVAYGTFAQGWMSLFDVQRTYFAAWITWLDVGALRIPWPGGALALTLLSLNLLLGGVIRMRKGMATVGVLIAHLGILLLFGGSLVESLWSDKGQMTLRAGETRDEFQAYDEWEIAVLERVTQGTATEWVLPSARVERLAPGQAARFHHEGLPFDLVVAGWERHCEPRRAGPGAGVAASVEGVVLQALAPATSTDATNVPGCRVTLEPRAEGVPLRTLLWGGTSIYGAGGGPHPWVVHVGGRRFEVDLRTRRFPLPFALELTKFVHKEHPGTRMDSEFSSYVTKHEGRAAREAHITMNEPLRHAGYTFYQSGWGPRDAKPGERLFSTFAVVRNPSDRVPLLACLVIAAGLLLHFGRKLYLHVRAESSRTASRRVSSPQGALR